METKEIAQEINQKAESGAVEVMAALTKEAERVITSASRAAKQEAEQEIERILKQYEQKTRQIVLKIREEAKARAAEIADSVREAIMQGIEQASTDAIAEAIAESSRNVEGLVKKRLEIAKGQPASAEAKIETGSDTDQPRNLTRQEDAAKDSGKARDTRQETEPKTEDEDTETKQPIEDFDRWLSQ